ncbi:MAG: TIR domain-containing protein [Fimbriimonadaceae bacterium]|nr:TIR domain-containing protein [Fimbriimonadaceae bacterium]
MMHTGCIFISHSARDRDIADVVQTYLESQGRRVWIAPRDVPAGMRYPDAIIGAIRDCDIGLLVLSEHANVSPSVLREVERLSSDGKPLFVLRVDPLELSDGLSYFASVLQWVEAPRERLLHQPADILRHVLESGVKSQLMPPVVDRLSRADIGTEDHTQTDVGLAAFADTQRRMLSTFGVAVLDFICQQADPARPIPRRELLGLLTKVSPGIFEGLSPRQFETLLNDARSKGCAPGLSESPQGLFVIEENIAVKRERNRVAKGLIARHAARLVGTGMTVAVDGGSTTLPIVEHILAAVDSGDIENITIVTNSLTSATVVSQYMSSEGWTDESSLVALHLVGGIVRPNTHATTWGDHVGRESEELREELRAAGTPIDLGFVGGNGFGLQSGITMGSDDELGFKQFVIEQAAIAFVVADSSKAGISLPVQIVDWQSDFTLLTNVLTSDDLIELEDLVLSGKIVEVRE